MASWAEVDSFGIVLRVILTDNDDPNGDEGYTWLTEAFGGTWIQTSYTNKIRKSYASIGSRYDSVLDAFVPPSPGPEYVFDEDQWAWFPPQVMGDQSLQPTVVPAIPPAT